MGLPMWILGMATASLVLLALRSGRHGGRFGPAEHMSGLFGGPYQPSRPRGVQEEDTIRPWGIPSAMSPPADRPANEGTDDPPPAGLEDAIAPVGVTRVRRAA